MKKQKIQPFATLDNLHVGDTIWNTVQSMFSQDRISEIKAYPYTVVELNKSSFYVVDPDRPNSRFRHSMQTGETKGSFGFHHMTFRTEDDFLNWKDRKLRAIELRVKLVEQIKNMPLSQLDELNNHLNN